MQPLRIVQQAIGAAVLTALAGCAYFTAPPPPPGERVGAAAAATPEPPAGPAPQILARVESVQPPAWVERGGVKVAIKPGWALYGDDLLITGAKARMALALEGGASAQIGADTRLELRVPIVAGGMTGRDEPMFFLHRGAARVATPPIKDSNRPDLGIRAGKALDGATRSGDLWARVSGKRASLGLIGGTAEVRAGAEAPIAFDQPGTLQLVRGKVAEAPEVQSRETIGGWLWSVKPDPQRPLLTADGPWAVDVLAGTDPKYVRKHAGQLQAEGYPAVVVPAKRDPKILRLTVSRFATRPDAERFAKVMAESGHASPWARGPYFVETPGPALPVERPLLLGRIEAVQLPAWLDRYGVRIGIKPGWAVYTGDRLSTGKTGRVVVALTDGARLKLGAASLLELRTPVISAGMSRAHQPMAGLVRGALRLSVPPIVDDTRPGLAIRIGEALGVSLRGGEIWGEVDEQQSRVALTEGAAEITAAGLEPQPFPLDQPGSEILALPETPVEPPAPLEPALLRRWTRRVEPAADGALLIADGGYSVNLMAGRDEQKTREAADRLQHDGYPAEVVPAAINGTTMHRVVVRRFASRPDAQRFAAAAAGLGYRGAWVIAAPAPAAEAPAAPAPMPADAAPPPAPPAGAL